MRFAFLRGAKYDRVYPNKRRFQSSTQKTYVTCSKVKKKQLKTLDGGGLRALEDHRDILPRKRNERGPIRSEGDRETSRT